jgi:hypothetical protein
MQVALTLFFSLSSIAVPTLIGDEAFGNLILTVAGRLHCAGEVCVFFSTKGIQWVCSCFGYIMIYYIRI